MSKQDLGKTEVEILRAEIEAFIGERLKAKLDKLSDDEHGKREQLQRDSDREIWLESASKRALQIRLITHALKYIHPDARGSSVYLASCAALPEPLVSSAGEILADDVVGNAAALDVFKFLKLEIGDRTVLQRVEANDPALKAAFCDDARRAQQWRDAFAGIKQGDGAPASHTLAKQVYFPLTDGTYHLLAPLYPSSLVHRLHQKVQHDQDEAKAARKAKRNGSPNTHGYREYPNLATRRFGGSNPQNISQLNSERRGIGYMLASCPPHWKRQGILPPTKVTTIFSNWLNRSYDIREGTKALKTYLENLRPGYTNIHIRNARERFVKALVDEILDLGEAVRAIAPGWSADSGCQLDPIEACWLDANRAITDQAFAKRCQTTDWPAEVSHRFGNWLNVAIRSDRMPVGDPEHREWMNVLGQELDWLQKELRDE